MQHQNLKSRKRQPINISIYISAFLIATAIFSLGFFMSEYLNNKRFANINQARDVLRIQILDMETQLAHFKHMICADVGADILTHELHVIGEKLEFMSGELGKDRSEVVHLKKYYALLQIRHYQLSKQLNERCNLGLSHILYFHSEPKYCPNCREQGIILTHLRREYPWLRIYSFDYNLDLLALNVIRPAIPSEHTEEENNRENTSRGSRVGVSKNYLPILVINNNPYFGFKNIEEVRALIK